MDRFYRVWEMADANKRKLMTSAVQKVEGKDFNIENRKDNAKRKANSEIDVKVHVLSVMFSSPGNIYFVSFRRRNKKQLRMKVTLMMTMRMTVIQMPLPSTKVWSTSHFWLIFNAFYF